MARWPNPWYIALAVGRCATASSIAQPWGWSPPGRPRRALVMAVAMLVMVFRIVVHNKNGIITYNHQELQQESTDSQAQLRIY